MPSIVECVPPSRGRLRVRLRRRCGRALGALGLALALAAPLGGCAAGAARPEASVAGPAKGGWWRECRRPTIRASGVQPSGERADLADARARLEAARQMGAATAGPVGALDLRELFGRTSRGLNNLVRSGGDLGQADMTAPVPATDPATWRARRVAYETAETAWRRTLAEACREAADAAAAADALSLREAQARASLADAEIATAALRRRAGTAAEADPAVILAERETGIRRARLAEISTLARAARGRLAQVLQAAEPR